MKKMKKILALLLCLVLAVGAVTGTLAYLTDRDSEVNVFTVGDVKIELNENFVQYAKLIPGETIEKEATITNTGANDAWVWMTVAVPSALDKVGSGATNSNDNVIHWNVPGAFWEGYNTNQKYIDSAIANGYLPAGSTGVAANETWNVNDKVAVKENVTIDGVSYNVYTLLYNKAIAKNETTNIGLSTVSMDANIDIDTDGKWYHVVNGVVTDLKWNSNMTPKIYVSAYAIQADGFESVEEAYEAYNTQWGANGTEYDAE